MRDHGFTSLFEAAMDKLRPGMVTRNAINTGDFALQPRFS